MAEDVMTDTPPTAPAAAPTGGEAPDWRATLPDDLKAEKSLSSFKDVATLAKSYVETKKLVGQKTDGMIRVPGPDAKPEEIAAYRAATGVPDAPTKYELKPPDLDGTPMTFDEARINHWKGVFHEAGLTPPQAQKLIDAFAAEGKGYIDQQGQQWAQEMRDLQSEWGNLRFTRSATYATRAVDMFFPPEFKAWLDVTRMGDNPLLFKGLAKIGEQFAEDGIIEGRVEGVPTGEEATARINELMTAHFNAVKNGDDREADRTREEIMRLRRLQKGATEPVTTVG